jgi:hypothetical protein
LSFRYSLFLFLKCLLVAHLILFRLFPFISLGSCILWSNNILHRTMAHAFSVHNNLDSLADILIFSLIVSQALFAYTSVSKFSSAANLFEISTRYCSSVGPSTSHNPMDLHGYLFTYCSSPSTSFNFLKLKLSI